LFFWNYHLDVVEFETGEKIMMFQSLFFWNHCLNLYDKYVSVAKFLFQ
jgi:hypothetical protein